MMTAHNNLLNDRQLLLLAIAIERYCAQLYQECAYRFRPSDSGISTILEELAKEERQHEQHLIALYKEVIGEEVAQDLMPPLELQAYLQGLHQISDHFFVVNLSMGKSILEMALEVERYTHRFYLEFHEMTDDPHISAMVHKLVAFEEDHVRIIIERLESL